MARLAFPLAAPLLARLDAEQAHDLTIRALKISPCATPARPGGLAQNVFGLDFPNPLGLAAGFDKNAEVPDATLGFGFGFAEVGTVTPLPQKGNPRPRLFRLPQDRAVINRMGFNNEGHAAMLRRLVDRKRAGIVGVNIGANKDSPNRVADYCQGLETFAEIAAYVAVNISSPNTPGLRGLQSRDELSSLLSALNETRGAFRTKVPLLLKIAPDLGETELEDIAACCGGGAVDGVIVSNTTISRPPLRSRHKGEAGGLSGEPLFTLSTQQLARFHLLSDGAIPLIGAGGIHDAESAWAKIEAGATLLQLYSALVYRGPALVADILDGLNARIEASGVSLSEVRGRRAEEIAHHGLSGR
ncbi:MAG: quinone-dependent dihydroorotate dehydrogenase [Rhizobiales bacterium]|nr:quinone-dependent dihydroorotate dehydrogenase [Hyphomicrobiales bacterium]